MNKIGKTGLIFSLFFVLAGLIFLVGRTPTVEPEEGLMVQVFNKDGSKMDISKGDFHWLKEKLPADVVNVTARLEDSVSPAKGTSMQIKFETETRSRWGTVRMEGILPMTILRTIAEVVNDDAIEE